MRHARIVAAASCAAALCALSVAGCRRAPPEDDGQSTTRAGGGDAPAPVETAKPLDHLAPGELVEGSEQAFGLTLPRELHVEFSDKGDVRAVGMVTLHALVKYLRAHVQESEVVEGDQYADLHKVKLHGKPGELYEMHLSPAGFRGTTLLVQDVTPVAAPALPDEAARWRAVGLTPNGKVLDPTHLD